MSGNAGSKEYFDPYQVVEVEQKPCYQLTVTILRGRNIEEAAKHLVEAPDPYIKVSLSTSLSPNVKFKTKNESLDEEGKPFWNHRFSFLVDLNLANNILNIQLYCEETGADKIIGIGVFDINKLDTNSLTPQTFKLECKGEQGPAEIDVELLLYENTKPDLRYSISLCDDEKEFLIKRQHHVFESLKQIFGDRAPASIHDVPGIGMVHSGGGLRAMMATCGVLKGFHEAGLFDVVSYMSCQSGSTWYLSHLYAHPDWPERCPGDLVKDLKQEVTSSFANHLLRPDVMYKTVKTIKRKRKSGQSVSFTDFVGHIIGKALQPHKFDAKLSDEAHVLSSGKVPMPIFATCTVRSDILAEKFHEWIECTAFEVAMAKYGIAMKTEHFGSKFFLGRVVKHYPEPPLHFFQGIWGSVWAIKLSILIGRLRKIGMCCFKIKMLEDRLVHAPTTAHADMVLTAKKLRADLQERDDDLPLEDDVTNLNGKDDDAKDDSDAEENTPAWYQHLHHSAEQNALARHRDPEAAAKATKVNQVSPQEDPEMEMETAKPEEEEEADPMTLLDEIVKLLKHDASMIGNRTGRAANIFNFLYGLDVKKAYPVSPFTQYNSKKNTKNPFPNLDHSVDTEHESICIADAGIVGGLPFPPLLRPQRNMDILISFDYTFRNKDYSPPFKNLKYAESWAKANHVPFPKIDENVFDKEGMKEVYVFQNADDPLCPIVLHFPLVNLSFKEYKKPGVLRETAEEKESADFEVYDVGDTSILNLNFDETEFDRMTSLMEYNVMNNSHMIKDVIIKKIEQKKKQRKSRMSLYEKAVNNMANEDVFKHGLSKVLELENIQKIPSSRKTVVEKFMSKIHESEEIQ